MEEYKRFFEDIDPYVSMIDLEEGIKRVYVVRNGKKVTKYISTSSNKKIVYKDGKPKEVTKSSSEKKRRSIASKKGARKKRGQKKQIARKAQKSKRKRTW